MTDEEIKAARTAGRQHANRAKAQRQLPLLREQVAAAAPGMPYLGRLKAKLARYERLAHEANDQ